MSLNFWFTSGLAIAAISFLEIRCTAKEFNQGCLNSKGKAHIITVLLSFFLDWFTHLEIYLSPSV